MDSVDIKALVISLTNSTPDFTHLNSTTLSSVICCGPITNHSLCWTYHCGSHSELFSGSVEISPIQYSNGHMNVVATILLFNLFLNNYPLQSKMCDRCFTGCHFFDSGKYHKVNIACDWLSRPPDKRWITIALGRWTDLYRHLRTLVTNFCEFHWLSNPSLKFLIFHIVQIAEKHIWNRQSSWSIDWFSEKR